VGAWVSSPIFGRVPAEVHSHDLRHARNTLTGQAGASLAEPRKFCQTICSVGVGKFVQGRLSPVVCWPIFQSCPRASGAVQRLGNSVGNSRVGTVLIPDRLLFRPDISPVGTDRARVMRCGRSLMTAVGCCCCCQRVVPFPISAVSRCSRADHLLSGQTPNAYAQQPLEFAP
jgi:hypothetical protein